MYLLGHIALSYLTAHRIAMLRRQRVVLWAAFTAGLLPDYDLLFKWMRIPHDTYTHSMLILVPLAVASVTIWKGSEPYAFALLVHVAGDLVSGRIPLLYPISRAAVGLGVGMGSMADSAVEFLFFMVMIVSMWRAGDIKRLLSGVRENTLIAVPLVSLTGLTWVAENGGGVSLIEGIRKLIIYGFSKQALVVVTVGHLMIGTLLALSMLALALAALKDRWKPV